MSGQPCMLLGRGRGGRGEFWFFFLVQGGHFPVQVVLDDFEVPTNGFEVLYWSYCPKAT